jgi:glycosyltransferase involved in cell wall biosynthesis
LKVAYLVSVYPKVSHSFIRREILALERLGVEVLRVSVRGWDEPLVDPEDLRERERTRYVLRAGAAGLALAVLGALWRGPARFFATLRLAVAMARRAERSLPYHLMYFIEACQAAAWLRDAGSTHLHAHFGTNPAEVAMLAGSLTGIPYSFTAHGPEEFDRPQFIGLGEKIRRSAFAVAVSSYGRSQMYRWVDERHWPRVRVVHCGIERAFHEVPAVPVPAGPRLVCVGRLCEQKGQLLLIEAVALLAGEGIAFELVLAGDGEMRAQIEARVAACGLGPAVRITGWIGAAQVREEILAARALVLPSFAEGLPVVVMEAMALRRPVLSTYIAGIPELVLPGENGWLVPAGSVDELAAAMKRCLAAPAAELEAMGVRAHARVLERHDADREAARLLGHIRAAAGAA